MADRAIRKEALLQNLQDVLDDAATVERVSRFRERLSRRGMSICLNGIDGSGKTTLAKQLLTVLNSAAVPARFLHIYRWHSNVLVTPWIILKNRYFGKNLIIFDRNVYDNVAVFFTSARRSRWLLSACLWVLNALYPDFDHKFYLEVSFEETKRRRPDTILERFTSLSEIYGAIVNSSHHTVIQSDETTLGTVLNHIIARETAE